MLDRQGFSLAFVFDLSYAFFSFLKFLSKLERALGGMFWVFTRFFFEYFSVLLAVFATGCITWLDSDSDFSYNLCFLAINSPFVFDRKSLIFLHYSSGFYFSFYLSLICFSVLEVSTLTLFVLFCTEMLFLALEDLRKELFLVEGSVGS